MNQILNVIFMNIFYLNYILFISLSLSCLKKTHLMIGRLNLQLIMFLIVMY